MEKTRVTIMWLFIFNCFFFNLQRNTTRRKPSILFRKKIKSISINLSYRSGQWQKKEKVRYPTHLFQQKHILIWFVQFQQKKNKKKISLLQTHKRFSQTTPLEFFFWMEKKLTMRFIFKMTIFNMTIRNYNEWMNEWCGQDSKKMFNQS